MKGSNGGMQPDLPETTRGAQEHIVIGSLSTCRPKPGNLDDCSAAKNK
jgi:hypothetical protein